MPERLHFTRRWPILVWMQALAQPSPVGARRRRGERGQSSVEFMGLLPLLLFGGLVVWQLMLVGWATTSASNAARTGSRVASRGGDGRLAAKRSLASPLRGDATVTIAGETAKVLVQIPILVPGMSSPDLKVTKTAVIPNTTK